METTKSFDRLLKDDRVLPVVVLDEPAQALPLARVYEQCGIGAIEITLRSEGALEAAADVARSYPNMCVGVGTVLRSEQLEQAAHSGLHFAVSPGFSSELVASANTLGMPFLPGVCTVSEVMQAQSMGLRFLKFYPAKLSGGASFLRQIAGMFPDISFCPTGGIDQETLIDYLALPNVFCVGGTWLAPQSLVRQGNWDAIKELAFHAVDMCKAQARGDQRGES